MPLSLDYSMRFAGYALLLVLQVSFSTHHSPMDIALMDANWKVLEALGLRN
jgi:hypothetical protein